MWLQQFKRLHTQGHRKLLNVVDGYVSRLPLNVGNERSVKARLKRESILRLSALMT